MRGQVALLALAILIGWLPVVLVMERPPPLIGDEAYYARVPIEMHQRGDWLVPYFNGEPRYKKPPLMYWLVAISHRLFGENETASRLPSLIAVFLTAALLLWFGRKVGEPQTGGLAAVAFLLNPMTAILGNWGAPEATLMLFITAAALMAWNALCNTHHAWRWAIVSGIAAGLGVLTKGAPGVILPALIAVPLLWLTKASGMEHRRYIFVALWLVALIATAALWFIVVGVSEGKAFWQVFLLREHLERVATPMEGHKGPLWFYLPIVWLLFFPWSVRLPLAVWYAVVGAPSGATEKVVANANPTNRLTVDKWMVWWALSVIVLFSIVATKLPHYIFPAFPALGWLSARQWQRQAKVGESLSVALLSLPVFLLAILAASPHLSEAYEAFLQQEGFSLADDERVMLRATGIGLFLGLGIAALLVTSIGFASAGFGWVADSIWSKATDGWHRVGAIVAALTVASTLFGSWALLHTTNGHRAVATWQSAPVIATFGSDTEWVVFYAKRSVPILRGDERRLEEFLQTHPKASVLSRIDFAPKLREMGLTVRRFGIWCVAQKE